MIETDQGNELGYMPKDGWVEVLQDICPLCGNKLPEASDFDLQWIFEYPFCLFTGSYARPVCCNKVYLVWRSSDQLFHYEVKSTYLWRFRSDDRHDLNANMAEIVGRSDRGKPHDAKGLSDGECSSRDVREDGPDKGVQQPVPGTRTMQDMADAGDKVLPSKRGLSFEYDF